jgi:broad specificity phosphatase PhoE
MDIQKSFYFIRHGETRYNEEKRFQGSIDNPLNAKGIIQAQNAAENLAKANLPIDLIVTTPLQRALKTAEIIAEKLNKKLIVKSGLAEKGYGILEGMPFSEVPKILKDNPDVYVDPTGLPELEGSEKYSDFFTRAVKSLNEVFTQYPNKQILLVAHTTVFAAFYFEITGKILKPANGIPFLFDKQGNTWEIKQI